MQKLVSIILCLVIQMITMAFGQNRVVTLKALVLGLDSLVKDDDPVAMVLQSYGMPFDAYTFPTASETFPEDLDLLNEEGNPKYSLVIINGGSLAYKDEESGSEKSYLSDDQWIALEHYETKYGVRRVVLLETVNAANYIDYADANNLGDIAETQALKPGNSTQAEDVFIQAGVKPSAPLSIKNLFHVRVKPADEIVQPILYYTQDGFNEDVAASITQFPDGREKMSFYFNFNSASQTCVILNHVWFTWGTRSLFNGFRRVYFNQQIDGVFTSTPLVNTTEKNENFRLTPTDYENLADYQINMVESMPLGSVYQMELAFNGNGVLQAVEANGAIKDIKTSETNSTYLKQWPASNYILPFSLEHYQKDDVFSYFHQNRVHQEDFFWALQTFTQAVLDEANPSDIDNEIHSNIEMAQLLGLLNKYYYSKYSISTSQTSGLTNQTMFESLKRYNIIAATGNTQNVNNTNTENPYLPYYTSGQSNNYDGFPIIPMTPTALYGECSTKEEMTLMYNQKHSDSSTTNSTTTTTTTFEQILESESHQALLLLTKLRHDIFQFHQANARSLPLTSTSSNSTTVTSLLGEWTKAVVELYNQYVDWPLVSIKLDDMADTYIKRHELENCGQVVELILNEDRAVKTVSVSATKGSCVVPITIPGNLNEANLPSGIQLEKIGNDPLTVWVELAEGQTKAIELFPAVPWGGNVTLYDVPSLNVNVTEVVEPTTNATATATATMEVEATPSTTDGGVVGEATEATTQLLNDLKVDDNEKDNGDESKAIFINLLNDIDIDMDNEAVEVITGITMDGGVSTYTILSQSNDPATKTTNSEVTTPPEEIQDVDSDEASDKTKARVYTLINIDSSREDCSQYSLFSINYYQCQLKSIF